jgi:hypothetical protein
MTLGINPNMTAWFPYTSGARWVYPSFASEESYAYYYRHFTLYQESFTPDYVRDRIDPAERLVAEDDGYVVSAARGNSHHFKQLVVQYRGRPTTTTYDFAYDAGRRWVIVQDSGRADKAETWFQKGALLAGRFDPPAGEDVQIQRCVQGYYQRMLPVLDRFKQMVGLQSAALSIGEDVAQHDMVACASPGWQDKFDMPTDRIAEACVSENGYVVSQVLQSQPAVIILVGGAALSMFRRVFAPFMTLEHAGRDIYQLLDETVTRPTYLTIDLPGVKFRSRLLTPPHFSYEANFYNQSRLSQAAWTAFSSDFSYDAQLLQAQGRVHPAASDGTVPVQINGDADPIRAQISVAGWQVLQAYYMAPYDMLARALADEYDKKTLAFDAATGHLTRSDGPCCFCVNERWQFPEGCAYGKEKLQPVDLDAAVQAVLQRAREARQATPPLRVVAGGAG